MSEKGIMPQIEISLPEVSIGHSGASSHIEVVLPASKSISNRALVITALTADKCRLDNISDCDDSHVVVRALDNLAKSASGNTIDIGAAGTAMRFLTAMLCVRPTATEYGAGSNIITGSERMRHRPIGILVDALRSLGADIEYKGEGGFPPLEIKGGELEGGEISLPGDVSSQYVSALLMIGPHLKNGLKLHLKGRVVSRPYIEMTVAMMRQFGAEVSMTCDNLITVAPKPYNPVPYYIESDWSAASYWYEIVALLSNKEGTVTLPGLFKESLQGDSRVAEFFRPLGVGTEYVVNVDGVETVVLHWRQCEEPSDVYELNLVNQPDLAQTLVVTCCALDRRFSFTGLDNLRIKETDRLKAMQTEMRKLGYVIEIEGSGTLKWNGEKCKPTGENIDTYQDHRMAMSIAPIALRLGTIRMNEPEVVSKSYPRFWKDIEDFGFEVNSCKCANCIE